MPDKSDTDPQSEGIDNGDSFASIVTEGLWTHNPAMVQLLGLCPLLAISNTLINGLGLGLATLFTLLISNVVVSATRYYIPPQIQVPVFVLLIATIVTVIELLMKAWLHELFLILGIFIPLIVTNCMIIGRAISFASRQSVAASAVDAMAQGGGFLFVLVLLGAFREFVGQGTILAGANLMFGEMATDWTLHLLEDDQGILLALLPPGAFICLGLMLVLRNLVNARLMRLARSESSTAASAA